ncbi:unnamed protein product [Cercopithifilaria johnstoni]|uniref:Uncharacterized protein n=1 Tax=Cercopithifilaria johnstoni TaxID=2874296 RepID=A0A8J2LPS8_9BILA|nr:unnamed protein product [Cercopithifilaria johnstoni]
MQQDTVKPPFACFGGEALFLCCLSLINEPSAAVTTLIFAAECSGFVFNVNHFDIAPRYTPILMMGFSNGISALAGISGFILEHFVAEKGEHQQWAKEKEPQQSMEDIVRRLC